MRSKAILLALLALVVGSVRAEFVESSRAADAARNVASTLAHARARLGTTVENVAEHSTSNNAVFYAVKMKEGGTVFMSSDDEEGPVIGYASGNGDYSKIDKRSPLWALLNRGVSGRKAAREARLKANAATPSFVQKAKASWAALTAAKAPLKATPLLGAGVSSTDRVPPLVKSHWSQAGWGDSLYNDRRCYNYYTPVLDDGTHAVCGCVATAMAQIMRYWQYPAQAEPVERACYVSPHWEKVEVETLSGGTRSEFVHAGETNLCTSVTPYDWGNMAYDPTSDEKVRKAIGQLTSDAGISVYMCYDHGGSGALSFNCPDAFKDVFHYGSAAIWEVDTFSDPDYLLHAQNAVLANLDAGCPVLFGIFSSSRGGHAVVCDGYEYDSSGLLYVHLNMGWSGSDDDFYLLDPFSALDFGYFTDAIINIFPNGDENTSIISGRITDLADKPVEGARVTLFTAGSSTAVTSVTTSATGIYAIFVNDSGQVYYDLESVSPDGKTIARKENVLSQRTSVIPGLARVAVVDAGLTPTGYRPWTQDYTSKSVVRTVGNSWGNDMELVDPAIVVKTSKSEFKTLNFSRALVEAEAMSREDDEPADIAIMKPIDLPTDHWALNFDCTFHAVEDDPDSVPVTRIGDAVLVVKEGFRAVFSNIVFTAGGTVVAVETNAVAAFAGTVGPTGAGLGVELADGGKIEIASALDTSRSFVINDFRTVEKQRSKPFGFASVDYETATNCASIFVNANDEDRVGVASEADGGVDLVWGVAPTPDSAADATLVQNGTRVNYRKLTTAINSAGTEADLVIRRSCKLEGEYSIAGRKLTMRAEEPGIAITPASTNGTSITAFVVGEGGEWAISNLVVSGFKDFAENGTTTAAFISVENGGIFRMQDGARLENIENTYGTYGAIKTKKKATIILEEGSVISGCSAHGDNAYGGAITLGSSSAELCLCGGVITNCMTEGSGGGVYAASGGSVFISGPSVVWDNFRLGDSDLKPVQDNVYFVNGQPIVDGAVSGGKVGVWWDGFNYDNNFPGGIVATFADGLSDEDKELSADSFLSDVNGDWYEGVVAAVSDDKTKLVWGPTGREPGTVPEEEGTIVVDRAGELLYFKELHYAFDCLTGGVARVALKANCELIGNQGDVDVRGDVTLDGAGFTIGRGGDYRLFVTGEENALAMTNVTFKGETLSGGSSGDRSLLRAQDGGLIVLEDGVVVCNVTGESEEWRTSAGVSIKDATLVMRDGAVVRNCVNKKSDGAGGGIIVAGTNAVFRFEGGEVTGCSAATGGGVQIDNGATILISGSGRITGNPKGGNLYVADKSALVLWDAFSGKIGYTEGYEADTNVFGRVAADCPTPVWELAPGVMGFHRDADQRVVGYIATNDTVALLVWADAFADGVYTDEDGTEYGWVDPGAPPPAPEIAPPSPATGLVYNGNEQTGVVVAVGFTLTGNVGTNAGPYTAVAKLEEGYAWTGGSKGDKQIPWSIAKATYDMSGVVFTNVTYVCDGSAKSNFVDEATLPEGVSVTNYLNNGQAAVGEHTVTAQFGGDAVNYEPIADKTATLTITEAPTPPPGPTPEPEYTVTTNDPSLTPLAFSAIERIAETEWKLSVTNLLKDADYALSFTADLTTPFTTGAWFRASANGPWTTNVQFSAEDLKPAYFWRAHGRTTYVTNWLNAVQLQPQP